MKQLETNRQRKIAFFRELTKTQPGKRPPWLQWVLDKIQLWRIDRALARIERIEGQIKTHREGTIAPLEREIQALEEEGKMRTALLAKPIPPALRLETPPHAKELALWHRIRQDLQYVEAKHELQARYGLPLAFDIRSEPQKWSEWLGTEETSTSEQAERGRSFLEDVHALFKRFEIPDVWYADFIAEIAGPSSEEEK